MHFKGVISVICELNLTLNKKLAMELDFKKTNKNTCLVFKELK